MKSAQTVSGTHSASNRVGTKDRGAMALSWPLPLPNAEVMHRDIVLFPLMSNDMLTGHIYFPRNIILMFHVRHTQFKKFVGRCSSLYWHLLSNFVLSVHRYGSASARFSPKSPGLWVLKICVLESHRSQSEMNFSLRPLDENWFLYLYHHKVNAA